MEDRSLPLDPEQISPTLTGLDDEALNRLTIKLSADEHVAVLFHDGRVIAVVVLDPHKGKTERGVGIQSSVNDLFDLYGDFTPETNRVEFTDPKLGKQHGEVRRYEQRARGKYVAYAQRDRTWAGSAEQLSSSFADQVSNHVIAGTAQECIAQLTAIARELPVGPLVVRPQWPDMESDDVIAYLDELGQELVPALKELP